MGWGTNDQREPYRCAGCRRGHYVMPGGNLSNTPCTDQSCECWVCEDDPGPYGARTDD